MTRYTVHVHPRSKADRIELLPSAQLEVWTRAPALDGRANEAIRVLIAEWRSVPRSAVEVVSGLRGRTKIVEVAEP